MSFWGWAVQYGGWVFAGVSWAVSLYLKVRQIRADARALQKHGQEAMNATIDARVLATVNPPLINGTLQRIEASVAEVREAVVEVRDSTAGIERRLIKVEVITEQGDGDKVVKSDGEDFDGSSLQIPIRHSYDRALSLPDISR